MKRGLSWLLALSLLLASLLSLTACFGKTLKLVDINLTDESYAVAVKKGNAELLGTVNATLDAIKKDGTLDKILNKYFNEDENSYLKVSAGVESPSDRDSQLIVATHSQFRPFEFSKYESGKGKMYSGIDIEIAAIIAERTGKELIIKEMDFDKLLTAVDEGDADIAIASLTVNEERGKIVDFSTPYYSSSQVLIIKDNDKTFKSCKTRADVEKILKDMGSSLTVGGQSETTGLSYISAFGVTTKGYASAVLASQALINGEVDVVVFDKEHAKKIVDGVNKD